VEASSTQCARGNARGGRSGTTARMSDDEGDPVREALALTRASPPPAISGLFARYGKPLALPPALPPSPPDDDAVALTLDDGRAAIVRRLRVRMPVDVIGNDWFIL